MAERESQTASRIMLTDEWRDRQTKIDWMHAPLMPDYVNRLVSGRSLADGGHWGIYARYEHLDPLLERLREAGDKGAREKLSMVSLACGSGETEAFLINQLEWPVDRFLGLELDAAMLQQAEENFKSLPGVESSFSRFDFNELEPRHGRFDVIFCCHSIHHCNDLEGLLAFLQASLAPGGIILGIDFFGPTRFQLEPEALSLIEELFSFLPARHRINLTEPEAGAESRFVPPSLAEVRDADISESVRSSDLRTLLFSTFPIVDRKPMGGTLLRWLLQYRAGNFRLDSEEDVAILRLLQFIEKKMMEYREIQSDDLFFVLGASERLA